MAQLLRGERLEGHVQSNGRGPVALRLGHVDPLVQHRFELQVGVFDRSIQEGNGGHEGVERLGDIVGMADRDQLVYFTLDAETRKLEIRICELTYTLAFLDPETVRSPPDQTNFKFEFAGGIVTDAEDIGRAVKAADMVSDHVTFGIDEERAAFYVEAAGDTDDVSLALPADELVEFTPGDARSLFSIDYLKAIERAMPRDLELDLQLGTNVPSRFATRSPRVRAPSSIWSLPG
ncbi:DNA polymerase sliding clamp [Haladaptatus halobius]|uniref:DNA polymerase sliding clamp n=1 Tax=Haladaptatus halobius TaxID=2884875 RepID=UPI001D0A8D97|nr:DNA polymerase sliding clamp [Haladaptatus halobius]